MTKRLGVFICAAVFGLGLSFGAQALAQQPSTTATAKPAQPPALSETDKLYVQLVQLTDRLAGCQQQLGTKQVTDLSQQVQQRIEATYPGYSVNWQTGQLVAKPPAK